MKPKKYEYDEPSGNIYEVVNGKRVFVDVETACELLNKQAYTITGLRFHAKQNKRRLKELGK